MVIATFAGWIDGDSAKGRVKVEGRADGRWAANEAVLARSLVLEIWMVVTQVCPLTSTCIGLDRGRI